VYDAERTKLGKNPWTAIAHRRCTVYADMAGYEIFVGYLLFEALIGNTDRHHENWA
jgi:hypothetical protein